MSYVALTIRRKNGDIHKMAVNVDSISSFLNDVRICNEDKEYIDKFVEAQWGNLIKRYKNSTRREVKLYLFNGISHSRLAPFQRGLILLDYKTNNLINMQNYTSVGGDSATFIRDKGSDRRKNTEGFLKASRICSYREWHYSPPNGVVPIITANPTIPFLEEKFELATRLSFHVDFDLSPLKLTNYPCWKSFGDSATRISTNYFYQHLRELGFKLSKKEEKLWREFKISVQESDWLL